MKKNMTINRHNDIIDITDNVKNEFDVEIGFNPGNKNMNHFLIMNPYMDNVQDEKNLIEKIENFIVDEFDVEILHSYQILRYNDEFNKYIEFNLYDSINYPIIHNKSWLIELFNEKIDEINDDYEIKDINEFKNVVNDNIDYIFSQHNRKYDYDDIIKNSLSMYEILKLFDEINDDMDEKIDVDVIIELFEKIVDEFNNSSLEFNKNNKFKLDISRNVLYSNNHVYNNFYENEIYENILLYDLNENIDDDIIELFDIVVNDDINIYKFYESLLIENVYNNELMTSINYYSCHGIFHDKYNNDLDYFIELSIDDIIKILKGISNNNSNKKLLVFDPMNIYDLFENYNNSLEFDEFVYGLIENEYELLYGDEFYNSWNYSTSFSTLINSYGTIYNLIKGMMNWMSNLNLNHSFKFDDELYVIN